MSQEIVFKNISLAGVNMTTAAVINHFIISVTQMSFIVVTDILTCLQDLITTFYWMIEQVTKYVITWEYMPPMTGTI